MGGKRKPSNTTSTDSDATVIDLTDDVQCVPGNSGDELARSVGHCRDGRAEIIVLDEFESGSAPRRQRNILSSSASLHGSRRKRRDAQSIGSDGGVVIIAETEVETGEGSRYGADMQIQDCDARLTPECPLCGKDRTHCSIVDLSCGHSFCNECLSAAAKSCEATPSCPSCFKRHTESDLRMYLSREEREVFLDRMLEDLVDNDPQFLRCPIGGCGRAIERASADDPSHPSNSGSILRVSPCGRMLTLPMARHMAKNRFRCSSCEGRPPCAPAQPARAQRPPTDEQAAVRLRFSAHLSLLAGPWTQWRGPPQSARPAFLPHALSPPPTPLRWRAWPNQAGMGPPQGGKVGTAARHGRRARAVRTGGKHPR